MSRKAKPPATELMRNVAAALNVQTPTELQDLLVANDVMPWKVALNVSRWWGGKVHPNGETTIDLLMFSGLLRWPETGSLDSTVQADLEDVKRALPDRPAERRPSRVARRASGQ